MRPTIYILFFFLICNTTLPSQESPPIGVFSAKDYGAETQNWSISQSEEKYIYVANNKGLLEYNGASWQLYVTPNETIIRSVNVIDDVIYTGANNDFGYWKRDKNGLLTYTSLPDNLDIEFPEDEDFWNIISVGDFILFQSLKHIYIYNKINKSYNIINSETIIYKMFKVNETIYFQKTNDGIYSIENGQAKLISNHPEFKKNRLVNIFHKDSKLLIETENNGFFILENKSVSKWDIRANKALKNISVFRSIQLKDKSFILGTRSNGIIHLTKDGDIDYTINMSDGLSNNTVHWVFEDADNNIWVALENGINCINLKSPFSVYNDKEGVIGTVYSSAVFKNNLYLGTNHGLFYKKLNSKNGFKLIENIQEAVWCLIEIDNTLFCGHDTGTSIIDKNSSYKIKDIQQGTWSIKAVPGRNDLLLQGNYNGLYVLEKRKEKWGLRNKIEGFNISSKFFEIFDNHIFVSHEYKGVYKIKIDKAYKKALTVEKNPAYSKEMNSCLLTYNEQLLYSNKDGVHAYNPVKNKFIKDSVLSKLFTPENYTSGKLIYNKATNTLWCFSKKELNYISLGKLTSTPKLNKIPFSKSLNRGLTGYENISLLSKRKYLIGTSTGYIHLDLDKLEASSSNVTINAVLNNAIDSPPKYIEKTSKGSFENNENNIEFKYSVPEFDKYIDTEYQYQLTGMYNEWSDWSINPQVIFKNLSYGDYTFKVRARVGNTYSKKIDSFSFNIKRPWFLSNLMIAIYILSVIMFSLMMHTIYKRYYRNQREKLIKKTHRELEIKELENKQQLMKFNNDKLRQDIESKNRELGISTMSLIKKNEFLNTLKKELQQTEDSKGIKKVMKIIDRNLNNTDDWHLFEEAFNNADKDFLKKIKATHPALTSNDLRLCAYLRLNLSSKEIAPLLNISHRSVEVKRYRLRKKMDLNHEASLTDYILNV